MNKYAIGHLSSSKCGLLAVRAIGSYKYTLGCCNPTVNNLDMSRKVIVSTSDQKWMLALTSDCRCLYETFLATALWRRRWDLADVALQYEVGALCVLPPLPPFAPRPPPFVPRPAWPPEVGGLLLFFVSDCLFLPLFLPLPLDDSVLEPLPEP